ncbi:outer membrane protein assembly factor BamB family protein [Thermosipho atlanticus]|uniref:Outer membrane protein assembly factor BamB, contains PQQ-like beta-propeller repeat n=1 Tax=Thermosipho atlanticus DSM 15807 TaxID=1123380 RepID=A0A1M5SJL0_9BACT|nr:PQQ-binding-like beta-propeller repeat protein [Thermosipho atlanticus]SHH38645.1 Outer membrane protein assembly factor BamB, contains PQQ-like beta-propeller repeat [Thermosipho atlanticus DSM 15807]
MKKITLIFLLFAIVINSQVYFLSNDGVYKSFEKIETGIFDGIVSINNNIYILKHDAIINLKTKQEIKIDSPVYIGDSYFLSNGSIYKLENDKLLFYKILPNNLKNVYVYKNFLIGIQSGKIVGINNGKLIWTIDPNNEKILKIKISNGHLAVFTNNGLTIFDIANPMYPRYIEHFTNADDYEFNGYHVLLINNEVNIYDENKKLLFSRKVNGNTLISDGENIYIGNYIITSDLNITTFPYKIKGVAVLKGENLPQGEIKLLWSTNLNFEIKSRPVAINNTLFVASTNGKILALKNGKIIWEYRLPFIITGHLTLTNKELLATSWDNNVYAFDFSGKLLWKVQLDSDVALGVAWDGIMIYALSDEGYLYEIKDGEIINQYKAGKWPITGPFISLSGNIYSVDAMGYLWKNNKKDKFIGKVRNLAFFSETPVIPSENSFVLLDDFGNEFLFEKYSIIKNGKTVFKSNDEIIDAILGKNNIFILSSNGNLYVIDRKKYKIIYSNTFKNSKFLVFDNGILYIIGEKAYAISTNDINPNSWFSVYKDNMNSSSINY